MFFKIVEDVVAKTQETLHTCMARNGQNLPVPIQGLEIYITIPAIL